MANNTKEWEVCCAGVSYFERQVVRDADGEKRKANDGSIVKVDVRHEARMGDLIQLSDYEADRLRSFGAVQEPGSAPLPGSGPPVPTPFSTPVERGGEEQEAAATSNNPAPPTGLTLNQLAELEAQAAGEEDEEQLASEEEVEEINLATASTEELAEWIRDDSPDVDTVVDAAGDDPEVAQKLLEAENAARETPRKGVEDGLTKIINQQ